MQSCRSFSFIWAFRAPLAASGDMYEESSVRSVPEQKDLGDPVRIMQRVSGSKSK